MALDAAVQLDVFCLCDGEWMLCDSRIPASDSGRLISYVERSGDDFDVIWMPTLAVQHMDSLEACIEAAALYCSGRPRSEVDEMTARRKGR